MSLIDRLVYWLNTTDAPRFCPECGLPIEAERADRFDPKTGENVGEWYWRCSNPRLVVTLHADGWSVTNRGDDRHAWGKGMPRWFISAPE